VLPLRILAVEILVVTRSSLMMTVVPSSVMPELAIWLPEVNLAKVLAVPEVLVVTVFGLPTQLPSVSRQTVSVGAVEAGKLMVWFLGRGWPSGAW